MTEYVMYFTLTKSWCINALFIFVVLVISGHLAGAQVEQSQRYEATYSQNEDIGYEVAPAASKGLFLYRTLSTPENSFLEVTFMDTTLTQKWHGFVTIDHNYVVANRVFYDSTLFFVLRYRDFSKNDMQIIALHCKKGAFVEYRIKNFIPFNPTEFHITGQAALLGGYFNRTPVVTYYHFKTHQINIVPGLFNEPGELTQVKTYDDGTFDVLVSAKNLMRKKTIWIRNYDADGKLLKNVLLEPDGNKNLIFGRSIKTPEKMQIVAGVYGTNSYEFSKGIFVASIDPLGMQQVRYYNYADLNNFFKYMKAKREERIKSRIERRKVKGRKIRFNYRLLVHELVPYNDQYVLLGEAFYPKYVSAGYSSGFFSPFGLGGNRPLQNDRVFDGYYYTHAVVMGFDNSGKLLWDNSFEINDVKTFTLEQFVKIDPRDDKIALLYLFNNEIRSKIIKDNDVLEGKTRDPIKVSDHDVTSKNENGISKLDYWYNNFFIAYGVQMVRNETNPLNSRKVFFINKISYK
jgi:hypothetical protein